MNAAGHGEGLGEAFDGGGPRELVKVVRRDAGGGGLAAEVLRAEHSVGPPALLHVVRERDAGQLVKDSALSSQRPLTSKVCLLVGAWLLRLVVASRV